MPPKRARGGRIPARNVNSNDTIENPEVVVDQPADAAANAQAAEHAAMLEQLQRYRERFGELPLEQAEEEEDQEPPPPPPPPVRNQMQTYWDFLKHLKRMETGVFRGKADPVAADNWRKNLERNMDSARCPMEFRRDLAVQSLADEARDWWENVVDGTRGRYELTWDDFKVEFARKYIPREALDQMEGEFQDIRQGNKRVREYETDFNRLKRFAGRYLDEQELIRRFLKGLRVELRNRCSVRKYRDMVDLVETAAAQEIGLEEELKQTKGIPAKGTKRTWDTANAAPSVSHSGVCRKCGKKHYGECRPVICYKCNQPGHYQSDCPRGAPTRGCHRCGQEGHLSRDCRKQFQGQHPGNRNREALPPPPPRPAAGPRVLAAGGHRHADVIAGM